RQSSGVRIDKSVHIHRAPSCRQIVPLFCEKPLDRLVVCIDERVISAHDVAEAGTRKTLVSELVDARIHDAQPGSCLLLDQARDSRPNWRSETCSTRCFKKRRIRGAGSMIVGMVQQDKRRPRDHRYVRNIALSIFRNTLAALPLWLREDCASPAPTSFILACVTLRTLVPHGLGDEADIVTVLVVVRLK